MLLRLPISIMIALVLSPVYLNAQARGAEPQQVTRSRAIDEPIDINHAPVEQLLKVPGMTQSWAQRIVRFRPYRTKQDLLDEGVLPGEVYNRVKDYVVAHRDKK